MINGQGIGKSHDGILQFNHHPFSGCIPCADGFDCKNLPDPTFNDPVSQFGSSGADAVSTTQNEAKKNANPLSQESGSPRSALFEAFVLCVVPMTLIMVLFDVSRWFN